MLLVHYNYILRVFFQHILSDIKKCNTSFAFSPCDVGSAISLTFCLFITLKWEKNPTKHYKNHMNRESRITNCSFCQPPFSLGTPNALCITFTGCSSQRPPHRGSMLIPSGVTSKRPKNLHFSGGRVVSLPTDVKCFHRFNEARIFLRIKG